MPTNVTAALKTALRQLESERQRLDRQISTLRSVLSGGRETGSTRVALRRRGRRRSMSAAARAAVSRRMKAYWAKRRRGTARRTAKR